MSSASGGGAVTVWCVVFEVEEEIGLQGAWGLPMHAGSPASGEHGAAKLGVVSWRSGLLGHPGSLGMPVSLTV